MHDLHQRLKIVLRARRARRRGDPELMELANLAGASRRTVDVGANRGIYTYWLSKLSDFVEAFEPNPELAARLSAAALRNVSVHCAALSNKIGSASLHIPPHRRGGLDDPSGSLQRRASWGEGGTSFAVRLLTLDSFGFRDIDLIKIDVEGHEEAVLEGAWNTIDECRPTLIIELEERIKTGCLERVVNRLSRLEYRARFMDAGHWCDLDDLGVGQLGPSGRRINNFTFAVA